MRRYKSKKTTFRELTEKDKRSWWYVEIPVDRPASRSRYAEEDWKRDIGSDVYRNDEGNFVVSTLLGEVAVGSPEWFEMLYWRAITSKKRLFWEPKNPPPLSPEAARRYGVFIAGTVRKPRRSRSSARRSNDGPSLLD